MAKNNHLDWIRSLECSECGKPRPSEPHHLSGQFNMSGVGKKSPDWATMPLCNKCHRAFHEADRRKWKDKEDRMEDQRYWLLSTLIQAIEEGVLVAGDIKGPIW